MFKNRNEQGSALLLTIIITMILLVLGGALVSFSLMERGQVGRDEADLRAYYIARSGADLVAQLVLENEDQYDDIKGQTTEQVNFDEGYFTAEIEEIPSGVRIVSTGVVGSRKRTVSLILEGVSTAPLIDHAVYAKGNIEITEGVMISGDIATSSTSTPAVNMTGGAAILPESGSGHAGTVFVPTSADERLYDRYVQIEKGNEISGGIKKKDVPDYNNINFPDPPSGVEFGSSENVYLQELYDPSGGPVYFNFTSDKQHYKSFTARGKQQPLIIDLENKKRTLVIDELTLENDMSIILENVGDEGHLHLFVRKMTCSGGGPYINYEVQAQPGQTSPPEPRTDILTLYYSGSEPFGGINQHSGWSFSFAGNLVVKDAPIFLTSSAKIKGNIFTNSTSVTFGGDSTVEAGLVYAPNAHLIVGNGGATRSIVCNTFHGSGGPSGGKPLDIKFEPIDMDTIPDGIFEGALGSSSSLARSYWER